MPKIYDQKQEPERDSRERGPMGGGPGHGRTQNRGMVLAIVAILAIIILVMIYRMARGEELQGTVTLSNLPTITAQSLMQTSYRGAPLQGNCSPQLRI